MDYQLPTMARDRGLERFRRYLDEHGAVQWSDEQLGHPAFVRSPGRASQPAGHDDREQRLVCGGCFQSVRPNGGIATSTNRSCSTPRRGSEAKGALLIHPLTALRRPRHIVPPADGTVHVAPEMTTASTRWMNTAWPADWSITGGSNACASA